MTEIIPAINLEEYYKPIDPKYLERKFNSIMKLIERNIHPFKVLDKFLPMIDEVMEHSYKGAVCTKGCSHCCHVPVGITTIEAQYIAKRTGHKNMNPPRSENDFKLTDTSACVFLKDGLCSIYEYRPVVCRVFTVFDSPDFCADPNYPEHIMVSLQPPGEGGNELVNVLYANFITYVTRREKYDGWPNDIRVFFSRARKK